MVNVTLVGLVLSSALMLSCGVKGKPLPPLEPAYLGNGKTIQENENLKRKQNESKKKSETSNE